MRRGILSLCAAAVLAVGAARHRALAAPPEKFTEPIRSWFPDSNLGLVVFINIDRETMCTPGAGGLRRGVPRLDRGRRGRRSAGAAARSGRLRCPSRFQEKETGQGRGRAAHHGVGPSGRGLGDGCRCAAGIGPCTDTDDALHLIGTRHGHVRGQRQRPLRVGHARQRLRRPRHAHPRRRRRATGCGTRGCSTSTAAATSPETGTRPCLVEGSASASWTDLARSAQPTGGRRRASRRSTECAGPRRPSPRRQRSLKSNSRRSLRG